MASFTKQELHNTLHRHQKINELRLQSILCHFTACTGCCKRKWLISKANRKGQTWSPTLLQTPERILMKPTIYNYIMGRPHMQTSAYRISVKFVAYL